MIARIFLILSVGLGCCAAGERSGHARADLLRSGNGYQSGHAVQAALRLSLDPGWHTYWINPGEGGMPISVEWVLPEGWVAGPLLHPVPQRFMTGELAGYGYAGEVVIPVFLTAPEDARGRVEVKAEVSWLACDDGACVPGNAVVKAAWDQSAHGPGEHAEEIADALARVPQPLAGAELEVVTKEDRLHLELRLPPGIDPAGCEVFPATPTVVDDSEPIVFRNNGGVWRAEAERNAYATGPPGKLELVLAGGALAKPLLVTWERSDADG